MASLLRSIILSFLLVLFSNSPVVALENDKTGGVDIYLKKAQKWIDDVTGATGKKKITKTQFIQWIYNAEFKSFDTNENKLLSQREYLNSKLHCSVNLTGSPHKHCPSEDSAMYINYINLSGNSNPGPITAEKLYDNRQFVPLWATRVNDYIGHHWSKLVGTSGAILSANIDQVASYLKYVDDKTKEKSGLDYQLGFLEHISEFPVNGPDDVRTYHVKYIFTKWDTNHSGKLDFYEFLKENTHADAVSDFLHIASRGSSSITCIQGNHDQCLIDCDEIQTIYPPLFYTDILEDELENIVQTFPKLERVPKRAS